MIEKIADFLYERIDYLKDWDLDKFYDMMRWYAANGLLFAVRDGDEILGATAVRVIDHEDEKAVKDAYEHNPTGNTYYIEFMASESKDAKDKMLDMAVKKLGAYDYVCYNRFKYNNRLTVLPANRFKQIHQIG